MKATATVFAPTELGDNLPEIPEGLRVSTGNIATKVADILAEYGITRLTTNYKKSGIYPVVEPRWTIIETNVKVPPSVAFAVPRVMRALSTVLLTHGILEVSVTYTDEEVNHMEMQWLKIKEKTPQKKIIVDGITPKIPPGPGKAQECNEEDAH